MTITRNAVSTASQTIAGAIILFILYRRVVSVLGAEQLGIWSIVLATVSASRIGELGLSAGVTRFVAKYRSEGNQEAASSVIQTAAISVAVLLALGILAAYPLLHLLFHTVFPASSVDEAVRILPVALLSLMTTAVAAAFLAGIDACQRFDQRAALSIASQLIFLGVAIHLMPRQGLLGLAWAQLLQGGIQVVAGWLLLRRLMPELPPLPIRWRRQTMREMLGFGLQFQLGSIAQLLFEPLTKVLMGRFGGLAVTGYYEMARQFVGRVHQLFVSANQVIVPTAAGLQARDPEALKVMFQNAMQLVWVVALLGFSLVAAWSPLLSEIWLGEPNTAFIIFVSVLSLSLGTNALAGPAYFSNIGTGALMWNTTAIASMGLINLALGLALGPSMGAAGILIASTIAIAVGSAVPIIAFHRRHSIPFSAILPRQMWRVAATAVGVPILTQMLHAQTLDRSAVERFALCLGVPAVIVGTVCWNNPHCRVIGRHLLGRAAAAPAD